MPSYNLRPRDKNKAQAAKENAANDRAEPRQPRKAPSTTKKTTGTKKSGNTKAKKSGNANSTRTSNRAGGEDPQAADSSLAITLEDLKTLDAECLKRKVQSIYAHLGLQNIHDELTEEQVGEVRNYFVGVEEGDFRTLMKFILPGYVENSVKLKTLVSHLQRAVFPPDELDNVQKHSNGKYCGVSLAALFAHKCGLHPSHRWKQSTLVHGIKLQVDSVMRGSNYHCSDMSDEQLKEMLIDEHNCIRSKIIDLKSRSALLRKLWASQCLSDYTTQEVPHHAPTADGGGADASRNLPAGGDDSNRAAAGGGDAGGGGAATMPPLNRILETPQQQQSSVGNRGGNESANNWSQYSEHQNRNHISEMLRQSKLEQQRRDRLEEKRDKERAESDKERAGQTYINELLTTKLIDTGVRVDNLETRHEDMRTEVDEHGRRIKDLTKSAQKTAKMEERVKAGLAALGIDVSSPVLAASNDGRVAESGSSSLFESPKSSTPGSGLGLSHGTPQEVNSPRKSYSRRKSISWLDLTASADSPVTSAAAGAANNVDTDSSGSVEAGAKDEDGSGEEEIDERFVTLKNQLQDVVRRSDSTEADHLSALNALMGHVLSDGRCVYDEDLAVILEQLQHSTNTKVHEAAISIMTCFPHGVEDITSAAKYNHGDVAVSGSGECGQLGLGDNRFDSRKLEVLPDLSGQNIIQIAAGGLHNVVLSKNGRVYAWGCNDEGSLGVLEPTEDGFLPTEVIGFYPSQHGPNGTDGLLDVSGDILPFQQRPEANIVQVFAGNTQSLALCSKGNVYTWGSFKEKDSGQNFREEPPKDDPRPTISPGDMAKVESGDEDIARLTVPLGKNNHPVHVTQMPQRVTAISSGGHINAAILQDNTLVTWGLGITGEMARPVCEGTNDLDLITRERLTPNLVQWAGPLLERKVLQVSCGEFHLLVVSREGNNQLSVYSSGLNQYGQLGLGDTENRHQLTEVEFFEGKGIEKVEGANYASYFVGDANKKLYSVGRGDYGGLGITLDQPETEFCVSTPHRVPLVYDIDTQGDISEPTQNCIVEAKIDEDEQPEIEQVAAGDSHVIVITKQGDVYSWGFGENGQCGQNKRDSSDKDADITLPQKMNLTMKKVTYKVMYASGGAQHSAFIINSTDSSEYSSGDDQSADLLSSGMDELD